MHEDYQSFNKEFPVSLKYTQGLIERIHNRYPQLPKDQVAQIVKYFFVIIRMALMSGETISISGLLNNFNLISFKRDNYNVIKAKLSTPRCFRNT